jgi:hypothetical protein
LIAGFEPSKATASVGSLRKDDKSYQKCLKLWERELGKTASWIILVQIINPF